MQTRTDAVRIALARCESWYADRGRNARTLTERCEALWFGIDDLTDALEAAERCGSEPEARRCLNALLNRALDLQAELQFAHAYVQNSPAAIITADSKLSDSLRCAFDA